MADLGLTLMQQRFQSIDELPGRLRLSSAVGGEIHMTLTPELAIQLAARIDRAAPPPAPLQIARQEPAIDWVRPAFLCLVLIEAVHAFAPAAAAIAGLAHG